MPLPWLIFVGPFILVWSLIVLLTPFGWLRLVPLAVAVFGAVKNRKKNPLRAAGFGAWACLSYAADLLAWWLSKHPAPAGLSTARWGMLPTMFRAGFPVSALELPPSALGSDLPTPGQWWVIVVNLVFWAVVSAVIVRVARRPAQRLKYLGQAWFWLLVGAFLFNQITCALFLFWFD